MTDAEKGMQEAGLQLNSRIEEIHTKERELVAVRGRREAAEQSVQRAQREAKDYTGQQEQIRVQRGENAERLEAVRQELQTTESQLNEHEKEAQLSEESYRSLRSALEERQRQRMDYMRQQADGESLPASDCKPNANHLTNANRQCARSSSKLILSAIVPIG